MDYKRFKQLWDALVTHRPQATVKKKSAVVICNGMTHETFKALVSYGTGDKSIIVSAKEKMAKLAAS